ncbi:MAG TPA: hypothetical protein GX706_01560 [Candidatus Moranbacteria bacterium]|nr:hypothetical protein [Candidatus Moranbacteria bacterium]
MLSQELKELLKISKGKVILDDGKIIVMKLSDYINEIRQLQERLNRKTRKSYSEGNEKRQKASADFVDFEKLKEEYQNNQDEIIKFNQEQQNQARSRRSANANLTEAEILTRIESDLDELRQRRSEEVADNLEFEAKNIRYESL